MAKTPEEIKRIIDDRTLSHWHLLIASLLGSLASQQGIFNQAFLNRILTQSVRDFLVPYFQGLPEYKTLIAEVEQCTTLPEKIEKVVGFVDAIFGLAGQIETTAGESGTAAVIVKSAACRFCPVGVGQATLRPEMTFCPFPTILEETANHTMKNILVKTVHRREGMRTKILRKEAGQCIISYEMK